MYEIYLSKKDLKPTDWEILIEKISKLKNFPHRFSIIITFDLPEVHYLLDTDLKIPSILNGIPNMAFNPIERIEMPTAKSRLPYSQEPEDTILDLLQKFKSRYSLDMTYLKVDFTSLAKTTIFHKAYAIVTKRKRYYRKRLLFGNPSNLLTINFKENPYLLVKKTPKYLDISKQISMFNNKSPASILKVETFPYKTEDSYLELNNFSFKSHSLVLGASGSGKSKFLSIIAEHINKDVSDCKVVIIDPHANLEADIGELGKVVDFLSDDSSIDLFKNSNSDPIVETELTLELFKSLIGSSYNSKLERVLRHTIYLLLASSSFAWTNMKKLLLDAEYRSSILKESKTKVPKSITDFFSMDFNDLKTKSYGEAISPIISFIDEMELLPAFKEEQNDMSIEECIKEEKLTLFSLDESLLGRKMTKTLAGLIMQNIFTLSMKRTIKEHIILIIDEIPTIENPILTRFLSESRKYGVSIILAGQYFAAISENLKFAIFANTINYFIFRISKRDATTMVENVDFNIPLDNSKENKESLLTNLKDRELIARLGRDGKLESPFKCKTLDFEGTPRIKVTKNKKRKIEKIDNLYTFNFNTKTDIDLKELMEITSTSRKKVE